MLTILEGTPGHVSHKSPTPSESVSVWSLLAMSTQLSVLSKTPITNTISVKYLHFVLLINCQIRKFFRKRVTYHHCHHHYHKHLRFHPYPCPFGQNLQVIYNCHMNLQYHHYQSLSGRGLNRICNCPKIFEDIIISSSVFH